MEFVIIYGYARSRWEGSLSGPLFDSIGLGFRMMRVSCSRPMSGRDESRVSKTLGSSERFNVMVR